MTRCTPATSSDDDRAGAAYLLATVLMALAGWVDAAAYLQFRGLYVSFMSGNSTVMATAFGAGRLDVAIHPAVVVVAFVAGVVGGELINLVARRPRVRVLMVETLVVSTAALVESRAASSFVVACLLALAMGMQNAILHHAGRLNVSLTYVTGTLVNLGRKIAGALSGGTPWREAAPYVGLWSAIVIGAFAGSGASAVSSLAALASVAVLFLALSLILATADHPRPEVDAKT